MRRSTLMNRFYALGLLLLLALALASCKLIRVEGVAIYWLYPWDRDARRMARAVVEEDIEQIDELAQSGKVDVNMLARNDKTSFLIIASFLEKKQSFVKLLDLGADIHWGGHDAPVYYAAGKYVEVAGDLYCLEETLKRGLDPSTKLTSRGGRPIFFPLKSTYYAEKGTMPENYLAKLKLLISYGADLSLPAIGPSEKYPSGSGGNVILDAASEGYYNAVYYLLTEFEGIQYKDYKYLNAETNEYDYLVVTLLTEVEDIANADSWWGILGRVQEFTYPWFLKTVEWLETQGEVLDIPEDLSRILTIGRDKMDYIEHYKIDEHGNITPLDKPPKKFWR